MESDNQGSMMVGVELYLHGNEDSIERAGHGSQNSYE
jgi:hypothetical protein